MGKVSGSSEDSSVTKDEEKKLERVTEEEEKKLELEMHVLQERLRLVKMEKSAAKRAKERPNVVEDKVERKEQQRKKKDKHHRKEVGRTEKDEGKVKVSREKSPDERKYRKKDKDHRKDVNRTEKDEVKVKGSRKKSPEDRNLRKKDKNHKKEVNRTENDGERVKVKHYSSESELTSSEEDIAEYSKNLVKKKKKHSESEMTSEDTKKPVKKKLYDYKKAAGHEKKRVKFKKKRHYRARTTTSEEETSDETSETTSSEEERKPIKEKHARKKKKAPSDSEETSASEWKRVQKEKKKRKGRKKYSDSESTEVEEKSSKKMKAKKRKQKSKMRYQSESSGPESSRTLRHSDFVSLRKVWRTPLKFTGQYGKTDDWSEFTSLKRAIDKARKKDPPYNEDEKVEAALRSITAGTDLRKFLDGTPNLTLDMLMESLRSFYMEPDEKDLIRDLTRLRQGKEEDSQRFVMRGLDIVHQFGAKKKPRMSETMAYEMLLESLETGFINDNIRNRMRPHLENSETTEKTLLAAIKHAKKFEIDRKSKFDGRLGARVNEVSEQDDSLMATVLAEVEEIGADMAEVKQYVGYKTSGEENRGKENIDPVRRVIFGCKDCKAKGVRSVHTVLFVPKTHTRHKIVRTRRRQT